MSTKLTLATALSLFVALCGLNCFAQATPATSNATGEIVDAANKFLGSLVEEQRSKVVFDLKDESQRKRWSNLPTTMVKRAGLRMGDLTKPQRDAALAVLAAALSPQGYEKVLQIVEGDEVLRKAENGGGRPMFGHDEYFLAFLGRPSTTDPWIIQFGGHHLGLNITMVGEQGTRPATPAHSRPCMNSKARPCVRSVARRTKHLF
jgi:hypothetical protein